MSGMNIKSTFDQKTASRPVLHVVPAPHTCGRGQQASCLVQKPGGRNEGKRIQDADPEKGPPTVPHVSAGREDVLSDWACVARGQGRGDRRSFWVEKEASSASAKSGLRAPVRGCV